MRKKLEKGQTYFDILRKDCSDTYISQKKIVISDCDGVLTDGNAIYNSSGKCKKVYGAYDTEMISFLKSIGWQFIFVSKDTLGLDITKARVHDMHCNFEYLDGAERAELVEKYINQGYIVLFVGDSLSDIPAMSLATYAACPNNAVDDVFDYVDYDSHLDGGRGAFGDILLWVNKKVQNTENEEF